MKDTTATTKTTTMSDMSAIPTGNNLGACRGAEGASVIMYYAMK
jgi:hypothetical protein